MAGIMASMSDGLMVMDSGCAPKVSRWPATSSRGVGLECFRATSGAAANDNPVLPANNNKAPIFEPFPSGWRPDRPRRMGAMTNSHAGQLAVRCW